MSSPEGVRDVVMGKPGLRAEQNELRARMRTAGMTHEEIAVEFGRRFRLRPRVAHRIAHGWTQTQAAIRINAHAARVGLDPNGTATMTAPRLSEVENWPVPPRRRPTPQLLALLADVYGCDLQSLLDLADREQMAPADMLLLDRMRRVASGPTEDANWPCAAAERRERRPREPRTGWTVERMVIVAARASADFGRGAERSNVGPLTVEQFHADLTRLAERYPNCPVAPSFADVIELRNHAFTLLEDRQRPSKTSFQNDPWSFRRQMIEQARLRNAWWMSTRRSQRVRSRRNW
ncbi:hypothetical protein [Frankia sp. QA3]|uniref:hypothetical protein n=1 Tax=Frankia sp. QA3 TaxID=710111 RepID=UPI0003013156